MPGRAPNRFKLNCPIFMSARCRGRIGLCVLALALPAVCQPPAGKPGVAQHRSDVIRFTNGDVLTGRLVRVIDGRITFDSTMVGEITVPWSKVETLDSDQPFAVMDKDQQLAKKTAAARIPVGPLHVEDGTIDLVTASGEKKTFPTNKTQYVVNAPVLHREIARRADLFYGWTGNINLGATLVQGTNTSQTYTGELALLRTLPTVTWLPAVSKTSLNLSGTYGLLTQPEIVSNGAIVQAPSELKTNILHGDTEYDRYLSKRFFWLAAASADHNFGSGLNLQQTYGSGLGLTVVREPNQTLDLKANLHYQQQQFYNGVLSNLGTASVNLVGADINDTYRYMFDDGIKLNQTLTLSPSFNIRKAYSVNATSGILIPFYESLNFNVSATDNYLGDPPQGFRRNTFQFTTGFSYAFK
jgi:Protein of unknown function, DUF481